MPHSEIRSGLTQRFYGRGFTLAEIMVVVAVIALLVAILLPTLNGAMSAVREGMCKGNLYHIAQTLHSDVQNNANISSGYNWLGVTLAYAENSRDLVWCPSDTRNRSAFSHDALMRVLEQFYILQFHTNDQNTYWASFFPDILSGKKVPDPQVWAWYPAGGVHDAPKGEEWPNGTLPDLKDGQIFIGVDNDGAVLITLRGQDILFENWKPPDSSLVGYSRQYICKGPGTPPSPLPANAKPEDTDDKLIIELYGWDNKKYGDKVSINLGAQTSYGINGLVKEKNWRPEQYLVMDANVLVIEVESSSKTAFLDEALVPRHGGKVNMVTCGGDVKKVRPIDMEMELKKPDSLWRSR